MPILRDSPTDAFDLTRGTDDIPAELGRLSSLEWLTLDSNKLTGEGKHPELSAAYIPLRTEYILWSHDERVSRKVYRDPSLRYFDYCDHDQGGRPVGC